MAYAAYRWPINPSTSSKMPPQMRRRLAGFRLSAVEAVVMRPPRGSYAEIAYQFRLVSLRRSWNTSSHGFRLGQFAVFPTVAIKEKGAVRLPSSEGVPCRTDHRATARDRTLPATAAPAADARDRDPSRTRIPCGRTMPVSIPAAPTISDPLRRRNSVALQRRLEALP